jgi:hypothetical protein
MYLVIRDDLYQEEIEAGNECGDVRIVSRGLRLH